MVLSVTPSIGSSGGGASILIIGAGLMHGVRVAFGATNAAAFFGANPDRISVNAPSHEPGSVDIVGTNVDGQNAVAIGAYTFAAPESFDVNGNWREVSFDGVAVSGRIVAPKEAKGDVTIDPVYQVRRPCVEAEWHATRD
jgi:hypothetical protein